MESVESEVIFTRFTVASNQISNQLCVKRNKNLISIE